MFNRTKLKSKLSVIVYARFSIDGKKYPINNILIDNVIASIISPMVIGSFSILKFIIENSDARIRRIVLNSRTSNFLFSISENV